MSMAEMYFISRWEHIPKQSIVQTIVAICLIGFRRKFRSQTFDNMGTWKSRGGKSQRREEKRREEVRRSEKRKNEKKEEAGA